MSKRSRQTSPAFTWPDISPTSGTSRERSTQRKRWSRKLLRNFNKNDSSTRISGRHRKRQDDRKKERPLVFGRPSSLCENKRKFTVHPLFSCVQRPSGP